MTSLDHQTVRRLESVSVREETLQRESVGRKGSENNSALWRNPLPDIANNARFPRKREKKTEYREEKEGRGGR